MASPPPASSHRSRSMGKSSSTWKALCPRSPRKKRPQHQRLPMLPSSTLPSMRVWNRMSPASPKPVPALQSHRASQYSGPASPTARAVALPRAKNTKANVPRAAKADSVARSEAVVAPSEQNEPGRKEPEPREPPAHHVQTSSVAAVPVHPQNLRIARIVPVASPAAVLPAVAHPDPASASREAASSAEAISGKTGRPDPQAEASGVTGRPAIAHPVPAKPQGVSLPAAVVHHSARAARPPVSASARRVPSRPDPIAVRQAKDEAPSGPTALPVQVARQVPIAPSASHPEIDLRVALAASTAVRPAAMGHPAHRATARSSGPILPEAIAARSAPPRRAVFLPVVSVRSAHSPPVRVHQGRRVRTVPHAPSARAASAPAVPADSANPAAVPALSGNLAPLASRASARHPGIGRQPAEIVRSAHVLRALPSVPARVLRVPVQAEVRRQPRANPAAFESRALPANPLANHAQPAKAAHLRRQAPASRVDPADLINPVPAAAAGRARARRPAVLPPRVASNQVVSSPGPSVPAVLLRQSASRAANPAKGTKAK